MSGFNWEKARERDLVANRGSERVTMQVRSARHSGNGTPVIHILEILKCQSCDSRSVILKEGSGPHAASITCIDCGSHRWLSRKHAERAIAHRKSISGR